MGGRALTSAAGNVRRAALLLPRVQLLVLAVVLPLSVDASAQAGRGTEPLARIAYVKWTCAHYLSSIVSADVAGRHREMITKPERCRHFGADEYPRSDEWPR
jgi:hypothetical protein